MNKIKILIFAGTFSLIIILIQIFFAYLRLNVLESIEWYGKVSISLFITLILTLATKSYAKITGTYLSYKFQVGGAAAIFILIFLSSYFKDIFLNDKSFSFAVQIKNYDPEIMPQNLEIYFLDGVYQVSGKINENGIADFLEVKNTLRNKSVFLQLINADGYKITGTNEVLIDENKNINIILERTDYLKGKVLNSGNPVKNAKIVINDLDTTILTNGSGIFFIKLKDSQKHQFFSITINDSTYSISKRLTINTYSEFDLSNP